jgi:hypothetical protein
MVVLALLSGCLPKGSLGRRDELEADRYTVDVSITTTTSGDLALPPFTWTFHGALLASYTRTFRDSSVGRLIRFEGTSTPLDQAWLELRTFLHGPVLSVGPLAPWAGTRGHVEQLDFLWPAISPVIPDLRRGRASEVDTSWPDRLRGAPDVRATAHTRWTVTEHHGDTAHATYAGTVALAGGPVSATGTTSGAVDLDLASARVSRHELAWTRRITTTWAGGTKVVQDEQISAVIAYAGTAPSPALGLPPVQDDPLLDAAPLRLADGREPVDTPVDSAAALPFLLLPDGMGEEERAAVRSRLVEAGTIGGSKGP